MPRWLAEIRRRPLPSLAPIALAALAPKCVVCVLAYVGVDAWLGLRGQEICGETVGTAPPKDLLLLSFGIAFGAAGLLMGLRRRRRNEMKR